MTSEKMKEAQLAQTSAPSVKSVNPFDNLDFSSPNFETGVRALAVKLSVPHHPDHLILLSAVSRVIKENLNKETLKMPIPEGQPFPIFEGQGMNQNEDEIEQAARILRLLQIQSLREMQTLINETIVECQNLITTTPRTDTRLGKVGF
jgi:RLL motif containing protein 1